MSTWNPMRQAFDVEPVTLAAFLLARIDDDEAVAKVVGASPWDRVGFSGRFIDPSAEDGAFVDRFGPARALAECAAKRQIVQRCLDVIASFGDWDAEAAKAAGGRVLWPDVNRRERSHAHDTLHTLAIPYAAHPDYREEWRP